MVSVPRVPLQPEGDMPCTFPWPRTHFLSILQLMLHFMAEFKCLLLQEVLQDFYTVVHTREKRQNKAALTSYTWRSRVMEAAGLRKALSDLGVYLQPHPLRLGFLVKKGCA